MDGQLNNGNGNIGGVVGGGSIGGGGNNNGISTQLISPRSWIKQFCHAQPLLVEIDRPFIEDAFNLYGLKQLVNDFSTAMSIILDRKPTETYTREMIQAAMLLYGLIHARFICTTRGLELMKRKYLESYFGNCPRYLCRSQNVVPIGITDQPNLETIKFYCPSCQDVYCYPPGNFSVDSAYIGPHFPHIFFMTYENLVPTASPGVYTPRVFGFKVHHSSPSLCQTGPKRSSTMEPFQGPSPDLVPHMNGRRSSLPFLDQENEDESDGEYAPLPPPRRIISPVNSASSSNFSSPFGRCLPFSQPSPQPYHDLLAMRGIKRDSTGVEISSSPHLGGIQSYQHPPSSQSMNPRRK